MYYRRVHRWNEAIEMENIIHGSMYIQQVPTILPIVLQNEGIFLSRSILEKAIVIKHYNNGTKLAIQTCIRVHSADKCTPCEEKRITCV